MFKKWGASCKTQSTGALDISLARGEKGLGFNIKGGKDAPDTSGDPGIFVLKLRDNGAAAEDGRLREGDKIIEVNGVNVEKVTHAEAVQLFLSSNNVNLKVIPVDVYKSLKHQSTNEMSEHRPHIYLDYIYLAFFFGAAYLGHYCHTKISY